MADSTKRISELSEATSTNGLYTIGVDNSKGSVKVNLGQIVNDLEASVAKALTAADKALTLATTMSEVLSDLESGSVTLKWIEATE